MRARPTASPLIADTQEQVAVLRAGRRPHALQRPATTIRLSVDPARFHFFDPETGEAVGAGARATAAV